MTAAVEWRRPMTVNARVHKHRDKLRGEQCRRLDVWIGEGVIDGVRQLAKATNRPTWDVVQDALQSYVAGHTPAASTSPPEKPYT